MGKKKKALKLKIERTNKIYMLVFILAAYFTFLFTMNSIAYANLEVCKVGGPGAFQNSQGPVGYVLGNFDKR